MALGDRTHRSSAASPAGLSPWPEDGPGRLEAIARLRQAVGGRASDSDSAANNLGMAASAMVENYAPSAPQPLRDEALIRLAGYLSGADYGGIVSETSVAGKEVTYTVNHANAWRNSGAGMLLSRWRIRRAGAIG